MPRRARTSLDDRVRPASEYSRPRSIACRTLIAYCKSSHVASAGNRSIKRRASSLKLALDMFVIPRRRLSLQSSTPSSPSRFNNNQMNRTHWATIAIGVTIVRRTFTIQCQGAAIAKSGPPNSDTPNRTTITTPQPGGLESPKCKYARYPDCDQTHTNHAIANKANFGAVETRPALMSHVVAQGLSCIASAIGVLRTPYISSSSRRYSSASSTSGTAAPRWRPRRSQSANSISSS